MKSILLGTFLILLFGCNENSYVAAKAVEPQNIESLCSSIESGISVEESNSIMKGIGKIKLENTSGEKSGSGYIHYWNAPTDVEKIIAEPMRVAIPHNETCLVKFDKHQRVYETSYEFINEDSYQEQLRKSQ